jgi:hypothetical protein
MFAINVRTIWPAVVTPRDMRTSSDHEVVPGPRDRGPVNGHQGHKGATYWGANKKSPPENLWAI